jgi:hypothetical protein
MKIVIVSFSSEGDLGSILAREGAAVDGQRRAMPLQPLLRYILHKDRSL